MSKHSEAALPPDRAAVLEKIRRYEQLGGEYFFCDVEDDPPSQTLRPDDVDYMHKTLKFKLNGFLARKVEWICMHYFKHTYEINIVGEENLKNLRGGAIFTSNHFATTENLGIKLASQKAKGRHRFYKMVREGNYFMPGIIGWLLKYCDTLPISSSISTMKLLDKAITEILKNDDFILIYPEQSMWWNYQKPRPYRIGAYYYASKNNVPVVPCFTTLSQKKPNRELLPDNMRYTVHIMTPIYPDKSLKIRENAEIMRQKNAELTREVYEKSYNKKLSYTE